ncbi:MAG TPA: ethanolamine utilization protein EutH [Candidatus Merdenecus merdavium]|nr:ethanolamine utilization protein EutH [Candidatus Merdenecus merdavium]
MNQILMYIMAFGVILGGVDRILGNRWGYGNKFEQGFMLLGPTALSMVGIISLSPLIAQFLRVFLTPIYKFLHLDMGMLGGILAIDMGGYQLAMELAETVEVGRYAGIIVSSILGCTIVFTIPMGMELIKKQDHPLFFKGIMIGLATIPVPLIVGAILCGIPILDALYQNIPIFLLGVFLILGIWKLQEKMIKGFQILAKGIQVLITVGLVLGAIQYMTGIEIIKGMIPMEEGLEVVGSIGIVLLGSLPVTELLQRVLKKPLEQLGEKLHMNSISIAGLLISCVSVLPAITLLKDMDTKGKVVNVAFMVSSASLLSAHLGFTIGVEPSLFPALFISKILGGCTAFLVALHIVDKSGNK